MTRSEINENIRYNEDLRDSYRRSVQELNAQIGELSRLKAKISGAQTTFSSRQSARKSKLHTVSAGLMNIKSLKEYVSGMDNLLTGSEYRKAYNGLTTAQERVASKIRSIQSQVDSYEEKIAYRNERISYWQDQLRYAKE